MSIEFDIDTAFKLKKPCANCPFLKLGAIKLRPGRLEEIISELVDDDKGMFPCHKTIKKTDVELDEDGNETITGEANVCAGSLSYLIKLGKIPVGMRIADRLDMINIADWVAIGDLTIDPDTATETLLPLHPEEDL